LLISIIGIGALAVFADVVRMQLKGNV